MEASIQLFHGKGLPGILFSLLFFVNQVWGIFNPAVVNEFTCEGPSLRPSVCGFWTILVRKQQVGCLFWPIRSGSEYCPPVHVTMEPDCGGPGEKAPLGEFHVGGLWYSFGCGSKTRYQNGTLVSGNMDQNLRLAPPV